MDITSAHIPSTGASKVFLIWLFSSQQSPLVSGSMLEYFSFRVSNCLSSSFCSIFLQIPATLMSLFTGRQHTMTLHPPMNTTVRNLTRVITSRIFSQSLFLLSAIPILFLVQSKAEQYFLKKGSPMMMCQLYPSLKCRIISDPSLFRSNSSIQNTTLASRISKIILLFQKALEGLEQDTNPVSLLTLHLASNIFMICSRYLVLRAMQDALRVNTASEEASNEFTFQDPMVSITIWSIINSLLVFRGNHVILLQPNSEFFVERSPRVMTELVPKYIVRVLSCSATKSKIQYRKEFQDSESKRTDIAPSESWLVYGDIFVAFTKLVFSRYILSFSPDIKSPTRNSLQRETSLLESLVQNSTFSPLSMQPSMGCMECSVNFSEVEGAESPAWLSSLDLLILLLMVAIDPLIVSVRELSISLHLVPLLILHQFWFLIQEIGMVKSTAIMWIYLL